MLVLRWFVVSQVNQDVSFLSEALSEIIQSEHFSKDGKFVKM
jgi:hypothetical protein